MTYVTRQYGSNPRWLMKALREVPHEIEGVVVEFRDRDLRWRPAPGEWCAKEVVAFLRESEHEDLKAVNAILDRDGAPIEERRAHLAPSEHDYLDHPVEELLWEFLTLRQSLLWTLDMTDDWDRHGRHPYRGVVALPVYLHEINERDLEAAWTLRKLQEALAAVPARRR
jgi:hypothetical protein